MSESRENPGQDRSAELVTRVDAFVAANSAATKRGIQIADVVVDNVRTNRYDLSTAIDMIAGIAVAGLTPVLVQASELLPIASNDKDLLREVSASHRVSREAWSAFWERTFQTLSVSLDADTQGKFVEQAYTLIRRHIPRDPGGDAGAAASTLGLALHQQLAQAAIPTPRHH